MKTSVGGLRTLLTKNAVEIRFLRRHPKFGASPTRRMLCTLDFALLRSTPGRIALNFKPPTHGPPYNASSKNLVIAWDIFFQDWRAISLDVHEIIAVIPTTPPDEFWKYFSASLQGMSPQMKEVFHNS